MPEVVKGDLRQARSPQEQRKRSLPEVGAVVLATFEASPTGGYDHLALVVEETDMEVLEEYMRTSGVEIERRLEGVVGGSVRP